MKIISRARNTALNSLEYTLYAYLSWRVCSYLLPSGTLTTQLISSCICVIAISLAMYVGIYVYQKLQNNFTGSPPFAATAIILILTITIILNLKDNSLFAFSILLMVYCRLIKGISASKYKATSKQLPLLNTCCIAVGFYIATFTPPLRHTIQLAENIWRFPFLLATGLSLYDTLKNSIAIPTARKAQHILKVRNKAAANNSKNKKISMRSWIEAVLLCTFLIAELEIGGYYWLKKIVADDNAPAILAFIISSTIFIMIYAMLSGNKIPTKDLLGWGFIGPVITAPLHFMIGVNSNFVLALSGQAFFMIFVAAGAVGIKQRLAEIFAVKTKMADISKCWAISACTVIIATHYIKHGIYLQPIWLGIFAASVIWIMLQRKTAIKNPN